jgi:tetratricopeptide (TPR) repeat protein
MTNVFVIHAGYDHSPEGQERKKQRDLKLLHLELAEQPEHPFTLFNLGMTYTDIREYPAAVDFLTRCIVHSDPNLAHVRKAYGLLTYCHFLMKQPEQARLVCEQGLRLFPADVELRFRRAILFHGAGQFAEAVATYRKILEEPIERYVTSIDRGMAGFKARQNLAVVHMDQGDFASAEQEWRRIVEEVPRYWRGWHGLGEVLLRQHKLQEASALASRLQSDANLRVIGFLLSGQTAFAANDLEGAKRWFQHTASCQPEEPEVVDTICRFLFEHATPAETEPVLRELLRQRPEDPSAHHNLGTVCALQDRHSEAVPAFRRSLELRPDSSNTWYQLGNALWNSGQPQEAQRAWEQAVRVDPGNTAAAKVLRELRETRAATG